MGSAGKSEATGAGIVPEEEAEGEGIGTWALVAMHEHENVERGGKEGEKVGVFLRRNQVV